MKVIRHIRGSRLHCRGAGNRYGNVGGAERAVPLVVWSLTDAAVIPDIVVHLLDIAPRQLCQLDPPDIRDDVEADVVPVSLLRRFPDIGLGVELIPCFCPRTDREFVRPSDVHLSRFLDGALQFVPCLSLRFAKWYQPPLQQHTIPQKRTSSYPQRGELSEK